MWKAFKLFITAHRQTKYFIFTLLLYVVALIWTTLQAYARLEYSRSDLSKPILIERTTYEPIS